MVESDAKSLINWLTLRACILTGSLTILGVLGILVLQKSPIWFWFPETSDSLQFEGNYTPVGVVEPLLGHVHSSKTCTVLLSQHAHTAHSDGSMTARQVLEWHAAHGYNAVAVTDHNTFQGGLDAHRVWQQSKDDGVDLPVVLTGMEWSHCRGHYNFLLPASAAGSLVYDQSLSSWVVRDSSQLQTNQGLRGHRLNLLQAHRGLKIPLSKYPTDADFKEAFAAVHALGGVVVANHLPWSAWNLERDRLPSRDDFVKWKADYIEIAGEATLDSKSFSYVNDGKIGALAGTDAHFPGQHAYGWTCLTATNPRDETSIFDALRKPGTVDILFDAEGSPDLLPMKDYVSELPYMGQIFAPLRWVGEFFTQFYGRSPGKAYSFVDGFCGAHHTYWLRLPVVFAAVVWLLLLFCLYHFLLLVWMAYQGKTLKDVL